MTKNWVPIVSAIPQSQVLMASPYTCPQANSTKSCFAGISSGLSEAQEAREMQQLRAGIASFADLG
ncbi:MAG: hypothetical protein WAK17_16745 [Candidatus Nitrosopolaris sp.]